MAKRSPKAQSSQRPPAGHVEVVNPAWLLRALGAMLVLALVCGYATLCGLFYLGQWQFVMHPHNGGAVPAVLDGSPVQIVHLEPDESGTPQVTAWAVAAAEGAPYARYTALVLPAADGSLATQQALLLAVHQLGFNLFAIDYRGFGGSASGRPSEAKMQADAAAALRYLMDEKHVALPAIVPVGVGLGASLATGLAAQRATIPAVLLIAPDGDTLERVRADRHVSELPVKMLFHDSFPLAGPLKTLATPKLIVTFAETGLSDAARRAAASPKRTVIFPDSMEKTLTRPAFAQSAREFLDSYLVSPPSGSLLR